MCATLNFMNKPRPIPLLLSYHRKLAGLTQKQVTEALDLSPKIVSMWERGVRFPSDDMLKQLAKLYGCQVEELYDVDFREVMALGRARLREYLLSPVVEKEAERARLIVSIANTFRNDEGVAPQVDPGWTSVSDLIHIYGEPNPDRMRIPMRDDLVPVTEESSETKKAFFLNQDESVVTSGPRDCSKTYDDLLLLLWYMENIPGIQIGVCRGEKSGIGATIWTSLKLMLKFPYAEDPRNPFKIRGGLHNPEKIICDNGAEMEFFGLYSERQQRGKQKHVVFLNQGESEDTRENYASLISAMTGERAGPLEKPPQCTWDWRILIDANPDIPIHWLHKLKGTDEVTWFDYKHSDHPHLWDIYEQDYTPKGVKVRSDIRKAYPPGHERDRMLDGLWTGAEGQVLNCFDPAKHLLPPEKQPTIEKDWTHWRTTDWGSDHPHVTFWVSMDPTTEKCYVWQEYAQRMTLDDVHADFILLHSRDFHYTMHFADSEDVSARGEFAEKGIPTRTVNKDIRLRINTLNRLFAEDRLYIFEGLRINNDPTVVNEGYPYDLVAEIAQLRYPEKKTGLPSRDNIHDPKCHDDRFDALGYWAVGTQSKIKSGGSLLGDAGIPIVHFCEDTKMVSEVSI